MNYKKTLIASIAALAAVGFLAGCGGEKAAAPAKSAAPDKAVTIKVGVSPVPHGEILNSVKDQLASAPRKGSTWKSWNSPIMYSRTWL